jgi:hypothetical protein
MGCCDKIAEGGKTVRGGSGHGMGIVLNTKDWLCKIEREKSIAVLA